MRQSKRSPAPTLILLFLGLSLASAVPVHPRQAGSDFEDSGTDYTGYTLEGCQEVFGVCRGHLVHPGHVPGGKKQCDFELGASPFWYTRGSKTELTSMACAGKCNDTVIKAAAVVVPLP
ncbi:hypothetical protein QBC39DRAFT_345632 [Podospora conica]|nr:hypothetical protein QBC39DRAFT_345632 [Schizothecium conicum]